MRSVLVIGAGPQQTFAIQAARRLGLRTIVIDRNSAAPGMKLADVPIAIDTNDVEAAFQVASREGVSGVVAICTDRPVLTVAALNARLGLSGVTEAMARVATHKGRMRDAFAAAGVSIPKYIRLSGVADLRKKVASAVDAIGVPAILKPAELSGSRGVVQIAKISEIDAAIEYAQAAAGAQSEFLVEEFIEGPEVSVETLSFGGRHHVVAVTDKRTSGPPNWVETGHVQPSRISPGIQAAIRATAVRGLEALGLMNTAGHVEIKITSSGQPVVIEIAARLGGDFIGTELTRLSTGVDLAAAAVQISLGETPSLDGHSPRGSAIQYLSNDRRGVVAGISGDHAARAVPGVVHVGIDAKIGEPIGSLHSSSARPGYVIASGDSAEAAEKIAEEAAARISFTLR